MEKYAPESLDDMVLSDKKRKKLEKVIRDTPHTLIYGHSGTGKSTFIRILAKETGLFLLEINCSNDNGMGMVRNKVDRYSKSGTYNGKPKLLCFEESDILRKKPQKLLTTMIDKRSRITKFFFLCNDKKNLIEPIQSRCIYKINLDDPPRDDVFEHLSGILQCEDVDYNEDDINITISRLYPNVRDMINRLESNVIDNELMLD